MPTSFPANVGSNGSGHERDDDLSALARDAPRDERAIGTVAHHIATLAFGPRADDISLSQPRGFTPTLAGDPARVTPEHPPGSPGSLGEAVERASQERIGAEAARQVQNELRSSEAHLAGIVSLATDAIVSVDS